MCITCNVMWFLINLPCHLHNWTHKCGGGVVHLGISVGGGGGGVHLGGGGGGGVHLGISMGGGGHSEQTS